MTIISNITKFDGHIQKNGRRNVWIIATDHLGKEHHVFGLPVKSYNTLPATPEGQFTIVFDESQSEVFKWNGASWDNHRIVNIVPAVQLGLEDNEGNKLIQLIDNGHDILARIQTPVHSTTKKLVKKIIRYMMQEQSPYLVIALEPLINYLRTNYTAQQLITFLDITADQATKLNARINAVLNNKQAFLDADSNREVIE